MSSNNTPDDVAELTANDDFDTGLRMGLAHALGQTGFNNSRDDHPRRNLFEVFGWPRSDLDNWDDENWVALYLRSGYAQTVNNKPVDGTWQDPPNVEDTPDSEEQSEFEQALERAEKNLSLWSYCSRGDKVAGIGQHGLLVLGLSDVAQADDSDVWETNALEKEFDGLDAVDSIKPVLEMQIDDIDWGNQSDGERWGKPKFYTIDFDEDIDDETEDERDYLRVHWSRVIDIPAQEPLDDEVLSRPRTEPVLNNILDIEKARGAAAEAAFMSANSDLLLNADPTQVDLSQGTDEIRDELLRFFEGQPFLRTQGMDVERLDGDIQDPSGIVETNLDEISATTGIPKKELRGNQSGAVEGSESDERSWHETIQQRRESFNTPHIVRKVVDRFDNLGLFPNPEGGMYEVNWPDPTQLSEADEANIQQTRTAALSNLAQVAPGVARRAAESDYIESGQLPEDSQEAAPLPQPDPSEMQAQFNHSMGLESNAEVDRTPPGQAQTNAEAALAIREKTDAMTDTGWRRANQLADGGELSEDVIQRMAQFKRHQSNTEYENYSDIPESKKSEDAENPWWEDNGTVAWLGWGGTAGVEWAVTQSEQLSSNATRYSEGDTVSTPQGVGVVADVLTETVESEGETIEASESSPTYIVLTESQADGFNDYKASELHSTDFAQEVDNPESDLADVASNSGGRIDALAALLTGNQDGRFEWPQSWVDSETPARVIALKAFAGMGGSFDGCVREMRGNISRPEAFCGDFIDRLVGNPYWRGDSPLPGD